MSLRYLAGFITASYNPLKVSNAPTISSVTAGNTQLTVAFTAPANVGGGAITSYIAIATTAAGVVTTATGSASPITITGLTNGVAYNVQVAAVNAYGPSAYSTPTSGTPALLRYMYSWGQNSGGQLGQNITTNVSSPVQVGTLANWAKIAYAYTNNTFAIKTDGTLWSWGQNSVGQLGQNNTIPLSSPVQVGALTTWLNLAASYTAGFAIKTDGTLWAWGRDIYGKLGLNNGTLNYRSSPTQVGADTTWSNVFCTKHGTFATKTDGTLWSWGYNSAGSLGINSIDNKSSPVQVGALTTWLNLACGKYHVLATKTDGTLWAWGYNLYGQLGQNNTSDKSSPVQVGALTTWLNVGATQYNASFAINTSNALWSWGYGPRGTLGQNSNIIPSSPVQVGALTNWLSISAGQYHTLATKTDKTLWSWGYNNNGQLGRNTVYTATSSPVQVGAGTTWLNVSAGYNSSFAISS